MRHHFSYRWFKKLRCGTSSYLPVKNRFYPTVQPAVRNDPHHAESHVDHAYPMLYRNADYPRRIWLKQVDARLHEPTGKTNPLAAILPVKPQATQIDTKPHQAGALTAMGQ